MRDMRRKYVFTGKLELKSAMHIGGGDINLRGTDSPVVLTPEGEPFIPGSSFKGVFRSTVEKLVGVIPNQTTCYLSEGEGDCPTASQEKFNNRRRNGNWSEAELVTVLSDELCDTCKLFGSPFSASKIFFSDLYVDEWAEATQVRDGVAIDRVGGYQIHFGSGPSGTRKLGISNGSAAGTVQRILVAGPPEQMSLYFEPKFRACFK